MLLGGDYSLWDNVLDWQAHDWEFAFIKASEGTVKDPKFDAQWAAARGRVYRGAYHFFRPTVRWEDSSKRFLEILERDPGELPPVIDLEVKDGVADHKARALRWLREVKRVSGMTPIVYTSPGFAIAERFQEAPEFANYPLWMAQYPADWIQGTWTVEKREQRLYDVINGVIQWSMPKAPLPWSQATFWQFTGKCPPQFVKGYPLGHKEAVDVNLYWGNLHNFITQFNLPVLPEGDTAMPERPITLIASLLPGQKARLRSGPGLAFAEREMFNAPLTIKGVGAKQLVNGYNWIEITAIVQDGKEEPCVGYVAMTSSFDPATLRYNANGLDTTAPPTPEPTPVALKQPFPLTIESPGYKKQTIVLQPEE